MQHEWIVEVLDDLSSYARSNELAQLDIALEAVRRAAIADVLGISLPKTSAQTTIVPRVVQFPGSDDGR